MAAVIAASARNIPGDKPIRNILFPQPAKLFHDIFLIARDIHPEVYAAISMGFPTLVSLYWMFCRNNVTSLESTSLLSGFSPIHGISQLFERFCELFSTQLFGQFLEQLSGLLGGRLSDQLGILSERIPEQLIVQLPTQLSQQISQKLSHGISQELSQQLYERTFLAGVGCMLHFPWSFMLHLYRAFGTDPERRTVLYKCDVSFIHLHCLIHSYAWDMRFIYISLIFHVFAVIHTWASNPLQNPKCKVHIDILAALGIVIASYPMRYRSQSIHFLALFLWAIAFTVYSKRIIGDHSSTFFHFLLAGPQYLMLLAVNLPVIS